MNEAQRKSVVRQTTKMIRTRSGFRMPKVVRAVASNHLTTEEKQAMAEAVALANNKKYVERQTTKNDIPQTLADQHLRYDTNELMVITKTKKLLAYVMTVMQKSPKYFRHTLVFRIQNYCLDALECIVRANSLRSETVKSKFDRKNFQHEAYSRFKMLEYLTFIALENGCILKKQYLQIAMQLADCINLLVAWTKKI